MPITNVTTAGTSVPLSATALQCARLRISRKQGDTGIIYGSYQGTGNSYPTVSSAAYDFFLDSTIPFIVIGQGETMGDSVSPHLVQIDASINGNGVAWMVEVI